MPWSEQYPSDRQPTWREMDAFIKSPLWGQMHEYLANRYQVQPKCCYSNCSMQRGWNVKYQKGGKALCTLYPMQGYFIAMIVIGAKEAAQAALLVPSLSPYTQALYENTQDSMGGRWMMISVTDPAILDDAKALIGLRVKPR